MDSTSVKAHHSAAGARKCGGDQGIGKSKGGTTSKIHMISAGPDEGITFSITRGETSDITAGLELIRTTRFSESHEYFAMDRGYSAYVTLDVCEDKKIVAVVPPKKTFKEPWEYHRWIYAYRNEIERLFGRLKHYRRSSTRFDKLIRRYAAFVTLGLIFRFLKTYVNSA